VEAGPLVRSSYHAQGQAGFTGLAYAVVAELASWVASCFGSVNTRAFIATNTSKLPKMQLCGRF